jgi:hypothetical protein
MTKLTDTQLIVLSSAAKHDEGLATRPLNLHAAATQKLASSLINKGLAREIRAKAEAPVWHENDDGRFALKISKAGREAIGVDDEEAEGAALPPTSAAVSKPTKASSKLAGTKAASQAPAGRELGGPICRSVMGRQRPSTIRWRKAGGDQGPPWVTSSRSSLSAFAVHCEEAVILLSATLVVLRERDAAPENETDFTPPEKASRFLRVTAEIGGREREIRAFVLVSL